jgi:hypothetical protein
MKRLSPGTVFRDAAFVSGRRAERRRIMAGAQFFVPQRLQSSRPIRRFTLEHANRTLPLVKRVVADALHLHTQATRLHNRLQVVSDAREQLALQSQLDATVNRLQDVMDELSDIGCELKDYKTGLIDFVGRHKGRDVYLCWKLGEEKVGYWHELHAGYAGRQPVTSLEESD